jgi:hypothetical protein
MIDNQISDIWLFFKEFINKKELELAAEQYVDLLADFGIKDKVLEGARGADAELDHAIEYYLEKDADEEPSYEDHEEDEDY